MSKKFIARTVEIFRLRSISIFLNLSITVLTFLIGVDEDKLLTIKTIPYGPNILKFISGDGPVLSLIVLSFTNFIISIALTRSQKTLKELERENAQISEANGRIGESISLLFDGITLNLSRKLKFDEKGRERVSIYIRTDDTKKFVPCGRFSHSPIFSTKGRTEFSDSTGCIAKGWAEGWHFTNDLPDASSEYDAYVSICDNRYQMGVNDISGLKMKSRLYAVKRISDSDGRHHGLLVVESMRADAFKEEALKEVMDEEARSLCKAIAGLRSYIPTPSDAKSAGL